MSRKYLSAGTIVEEYLKGRSLKGFCASLKNIDKVDYAIALQTIKYYEIIMKIFDKCSIHADELDVQRGVLLVMVYDLLFGRGNIHGGGKVKKIVMSKIDNMKQALAGYMDGKQHHSELLSANVRELSKLGYFIRINPFKISITEGLDYIRTTCPDAMIDSDIPSLIVLPTATRSFGQDRWVKEGKLIIQDKASCFPSQILFDYWQDVIIGGGGGDIIDACAAPGNKTSHIAGLTAGKGISVFAFEKNSRRVTILRDRMKLLGVNNVKVMFNDFLEVDVHDPCYRRVRSILLDPSCSGSGVLRSLDRAVEVVVDDDNEKNIARLINLQSFQIQMILKAMSFPAVRMIAYSTCSIYKQENEHVVRKVLAAHQHQQQQQGKSSEWALVSPTRFSQWKNRGLADDGSKIGCTKDDGDEVELSTDQLNSLIRCSPDDGTNGFFVALFHRTTSVIIADDVNNDAIKPSISVNNDNDNKSLATTEKKAPQLMHNKVESKKQKLRDDDGATNAFFCGSKLFKVRSRKRK